MKIAFDVDETLIRQNTDNTITPIWNTVELLRWFKGMGWEVIVWSGGGMDYAETMMNRFGIPYDRIAVKFSEEVDIAVDDLASPSEKKALSAKVIIKI